MVALRSLASCFEILALYDHDRNTSALVVAQALKSVIDRLYQSMLAWHQHQEVLESICDILSEAVLCADEALFDLLPSLVDLMSRGFIHTHYAVLLKTLGTFIRTSPPLSLSLSLALMTDKTIIRNRRLLQDSRASCEFL